MIQLSVSLLVVLFLASYGVMFAITQSTLPVWADLRFSICNRFPFIGKLFECPFCSGFWVSQIVWLAWGFGMGNFSAAPPSAVVISDVGFGFAGAAFCYAFDNTIRFFEKGHS